MTSLEPFKVKGVGPGEDGKPVVGVIDAPSGTVMFVPKGVKADERNAGGSK